MEEKLKSVESVKIDEGTFKYILVKVYDPDNEDTFKFIVRGSCDAPYHGINTVIHAYLGFNILCA